jgi:membrane protease YdiL (CAAX protease family)
MALTRPAVRVWPAGHVRRAVVYLAALMVAEALIAADRRLGALLDAVLLVLLVRQGARTTVAAEQRLYWALAPVPVLRLLGLALPLEIFPPVWRYVAVAGPWVLATALAARATGCGPDDLGLSWRWRAAPLHLAVGLIGIPLGLVEYQLLKPAPLASELSWQAIWLPALILLLTTGLSEELLFRGLLQRASGAALGPWLGPALITLLWTSLHLGSGSWAALGLALVAGTLFALAAEWTGGIWGVGLAHGLASVMVFLVVPLLLEPPAL